MKKYIVVLSVLFISLSFIAVAGGKTDRDIEELKQLSDSNSKILAEAVQSINSLRQEVQSLQGSVQEIKHFSEQQTQTNEKMIKDFDLRITTVEERMGVLSSQLQDFLNKPVESTPKEGAKKKGNEASSSQPQSETELYHKALAEINSQNHKAALGLLDDFIKKFPKSSLVDNAQYWKGEALYGMKDYPNAALEFQKVVQKYPKSEKVAGAILKQGYCFYEIKDYEDARVFLQKVISKYPKSDVAVSAKEKLERMK